MSASRKAKREKGEKRAKSTPQPAQEPESEAPTPMGEQEDGKAADTEKTEQANEEANEATETLLVAKVIVPQHYEEPKLLPLVVESYDGDKDKGLYHGTGSCIFKDGNRYDGEFYEGKMQGTGKFTWADGVTYEGDFNDNMITGKGYYMWLDGSMYEGDVVRGIRDGFGTFYAANKPKSYVGSWVDGRMCGKGRMNYDESGNVYYEGDWHNDTPHGKGIRLYPSGNMYQGEFHKGIRHGEGTMRWINKDEMYIGKWTDGVQNGFGQHYWFMRRARGSQYPLRNSYEGEFVNGVREGFGRMFFASGAVYEGQWKENMKDGDGKFIFKNGMIYEGKFKGDKIVEFPDFDLDNRSTPDPTKIRTRTPLPTERASAMSNISANTTSPSFLLNIDQVFELMPTGTDREFEIIQAQHCIRRHISSLKRAYDYYSAIGSEFSPDNTHMLSRLLLHRMLKDCQLHECIAINEIDRILAIDKTETNIHAPYEQILFREFLNSIVIIAYHVYKKEAEELNVCHAIISWCVDQFVTQNFLPNICCVGGNIFCSPIHFALVQPYLSDVFQVYNRMCVKCEKPPHDNTISMRQFLFMLKDLDLIKPGNAATVVKILAADDRRVMVDDNAYNLELEISYLEFIEAMVLYAQSYVTQRDLADISTAISEQIEAFEKASAPSEIQESARTRSEVSGTIQRTPKHSAKSASQRISADGTSSPVSHSSGPEKGEGRQTQSTLHPVAEEEAGLEEVAEETAESAYGKETGIVIQRSVVSFLQEQQDFPEQSENGDETEEEKQFRRWSSNVIYFLRDVLLKAANRYFLLQKIVRDKDKAMASIKHYHPEQSKAADCEKQSSEEQINLHRPTVPSSNELLVA